jgi:hypothetical protein
MTIMELGALGEFVGSIRNLRKSLENPIYREVWKEQRINFGDTSYARLVDELADSFEK